MKTMNWSRGFFRLWALFSTIVVIAAAAFNYSWIAQEFRDAHSTYAWTVEKDAKSFIVMLPVDCKSARGKDGVDYKSEQDGPWIQYRKDPALLLCWYEESKFRPLYPEYNDLKTSELSKSLYAKAQQPLKEFYPWTSLGMVVGWVVGICGGVLLIGLAIRWVLLGFRRSQA